MTNQTTNETPPLNSSRKKLAVVGACGHVGFPFTLLVANSGQYDVVGVDIDADACAFIHKGSVPHKEEGAEALLKEVLAKDTLNMLTPADVHWEDFDIIVVMLGTPVDAEGNPRLDDINEFFDDYMLAFRTRVALRKPAPLIMLRSTVSPGTTDVIKARLDNEGYTEGVHYLLAYCPERVLQGHALKESREQIPLIGAHTLQSGLAAQKVFASFSPKAGDALVLSTKEAEVAKLMTNMYRYINLAIANEFYMLGDVHDVNVDRIIKAASQDYPRFNIPKPGPNVGGPCLFKDGKFLVQGVPWAELINQAFLINEGFINYIFVKIKKEHPYAKTLGILGMTFKANSDDPRNSLSYRLAKVARNQGMEVITTDPYLDGGRVIDTHQAVLNKADVVVVMTPHDEYVHLLDKMRKLSRSRQILWVDIWRVTEEFSFSRDGFQWVNL